MKISNCMAGWIPMKVMHEGRRVNSDNGLEFFVLKTDLTGKTYRRTLAKAIWVFSEYDGMLADRPGGATPKAWDSWHCVINTYDLQSKSPFGSASVRFNTSLNAFQGMVQTAFECMLSGEEHWDEFVGRVKIDVGWFD